MDCKSWTGEGRKLEGAARAPGRTEDLGSSVCVASRCGRSDNRTAGSPGGRMGHKVEEKEEQERQGEQRAKECRHRGCIDHAVVLL